MDSVKEEQIEEIEALKSIYDADFTGITQDPPCFMIKLTILDVDLGAPISLKITFPVDYPDAVPAIEIPMRSNILDKNQCQKLTGHLQKVADESIGMAMVFTLVEAAQVWILDNVHPSGDEIKDQEEQDSLEADTTISQTKLLNSSKLTGGRWDYVIGLVGKPSAGKSTFFNAATTLDLAKTGAHPFTTIEPNIGKAFYSVPCPCQNLETKCDAAHGHNFRGDRYIPILLKDVAGLVPGAWEGKGRGNRFLNDLLDADVLIHILDVSGQTDEKGQETMEYDPNKDIMWIQMELHQWIYQNIQNKWDSIKKRPQKLLDMFTGYHATRGVVLDVFDRAGIGDKELLNLPSWDDKVLHNIVSEFLNVRFPILVVFNKCDIDSAAKNIEKLQEYHGETSSIAVSAGCECLLQQLQKMGTIDYLYGNNTFTVCDQNSCDDVTISRLDYIQKNILNLYGSTNVHQALCKAVQLKKPTYAFPVHCLDTLKSVRKGHSQGHLECEVLRDCISLKPGTTVDELHTTLLHYPISLLSGDFVRAETVEKDGKKRPVKKEEIINDNNNIIKIMTTKKIAVS